MTNNYEQDGLQMDIDIYKAYIKNYNEAITRWSDYINLMQTMLDERTI